MSLLKTSIEELGSNMKDKDNVDVNDKERTTPTDSDELASHDDDVSMGGYEVEHELVELNSQYQEYSELLKQVAYNEGLSFSELVKSIDQDIFNHYEEKCPIFEHDSPIIENIGQEVLDNIYLENDDVCIKENTVVSLDEISDTEKKTIEDVMSKVNSSTYINMRPVSIVKGLYGGQVTFEYESTEPSSSIGFTLTPQLMADLSKVKGLKYIKVGMGFITAGF